MITKRTRKTTKAKESTPAPPAGDREETDDVYDVEKIMDKRSSAQGVLYYVKWRNYPSSHNTWEPSVNILNPSLIKDYEARISKTVKTKTSTPLRSVRKNTRGVQALTASATDDEDAELLKTEIEPIEERDEMALDGERENGVHAEVDIELDDEPIEALELPKQPEEPSGRPKRQRTTPVAVPAKTRQASSSSAHKATNNTPINSRPTKKAPAKKPAARTKKEKAVAEVAPTESEADLNGAEDEADHGRNDAMDKRKKTKLDTTITKTPSKSGALVDFVKFKPIRLINDSIISKSITFYGKYAGEDAVIKLEKTSFDEEVIKKALSDKELFTSRHFVNSIYSSYLLNSNNDDNKSINDIKATFICPANDKVLAKYTQTQKIFFSESPDTYSKVVEPYIDHMIESDPEYNRWLYNILEEKSESDRVILNDDDASSGFMLVHDLKWSGGENELNLLAICHRRDIKSLRDLTDKHLTLLRNILTKGTQTIKDKIKDRSGQGEIRSYVHYPPSFYHFHVHFKMVDPACYEATDRDHLLSTVINNITLNKLYYKKSTITYPLPRASELHKALEKSGRL